MSNTKPPSLHWMEGEQPHSALWRSEAGLAPPSRVLLTDDTQTADAAYRLMCEGSALLWQGDFQNARQLLQAIARRYDHKAQESAKRGNTIVPPADAFHQKRMKQAQRARILGALLIPVAPEHLISLRRAPDVRQACNAAYGDSADSYVISLRELQGLIGAYEWRKKGVEIPALSARIHPHYGVFSPVRGEYIDLIAQEPLPKALTQEPQRLAFDIGTGTGVLAAVLARRGVPRIIATDLAERALACARDNIERLGLAQQVEVQKTDLFPAGRAALIVCNPPWVPARAHSTLEAAVYDPGSQMLYGFLDGLRAHLDEDGEGWLILSDLAEHLTLRSRDELLARIAQAGLQVLGKTDVRPTHPRASDTSDPLHAARAAEVTSLWRLGACRV